MCGRARWSTALSRRLHLGLGMPTNTTLRRREVGWWKAGACTDARTCPDPRQAGWCTRIPKTTERETPGAGIAVVAAARQASAQVKLSSRQLPTSGKSMLCVATAAAAAADAAITETVILAPAAFSAFSAAVSLGVRTTVALTLPYASSQHFARFTSFHMRTSNLIVNVFSCFRRISKS